MNQIDHRFHRRQRSSPAPETSYDCIFKDAKCFILRHWWSEDTFQAEDKFYFEADPTCRTIEMPVLFYEKETGKALAWTIDHVNSLVDGDLVFTGDPHEENTAGKISEYVNSLFQKAGFDSSKIIQADSTFYHINWGDIHCGTNVSRIIPEIYNWWEY